MKITYKKEDVDRVNNDPDFIYSKKHGNSLGRFKGANHNSVSEHRIAYLLLMPTSDVTAIFNGIIQKARQTLKIDL